MKLFTLFTLIGLSSIALASEHAANAPKADPVRGDKITSAFCAACHGAEGNAGGSFPKLAGQHPAYLVKQLQEFKSGKRKNASMSPLLTQGVSLEGLKPEIIEQLKEAGIVADANKKYQLKPKDLQDIAAFFAAKTPKFSKATDKNLALAGQKLYRGGNTKSGVPACMACHGAAGAGIPSQYPRLAGQNASYTEQQLNMFKNQKAADARHNDPNKMMQTITSKMTEDEIKAVAIFLQGLR